MKLDVIRFQFGKDATNGLLFIDDVYNKKNLEIHYLGYYLKWIPQEAYYYAVENTGFKARPSRTEGTYSKYNSIDDKIDDLHYYTTFIKLKNILQKVKHFIFLMGLG